MDLCDNNYFATRLHPGRGEAVYDKNSYNKPVLCYELPIEAPSSTTTVTQQIVNELVEKFRAENDAMLDMALLWRKIAFMFRDGHSDDIAFADACAASDELENLIDLQSKKHI